MRSHLFLGIIISVFFVATGCDNDISGFKKDETTISFTTFNARLGEELPLSDHRRDKIVKILGELDTDIVCIQEIYQKEDMKKIKAFLESEENSSKYKYSFNITTENEDMGSIPAACTNNDVAPVMMCVMENCMEEGMDPMCIVTNCWSEFLALPENCRNCLLSEGIGSISDQGDITSIFSNCMSSKDLEYEYSGNNGVVLLSKYPLKDKQFSTLTSYGVVRGVAAATIGKMKTSDGKIYDPKPGIGDVQVICTGLSKPMGEMPYEGAFGSWQQEQIAQVEELLEIPVEEDVVQRVIMGDFNGNIAGGRNMQERNPGAVSAMLSEGWYDPYFDVYRDDLIPCSVCPENPLVPDSEPGYVPDHIFFNTSNGYNFTTGRHLIHEFIIVDEEAKTKARYSVSDHYAVSATMSAEK